MPGSYSSDGGACLRQSLGLCSCDIRSMHGSITGQRKIYPQVPNMKVKDEGGKNERL